MLLSPGSTLRFTAYILTLLPLMAGALRAAQTEAQSIPAADLLGASAAATKIPVGCVHEVVDRKHVPKGAVFCAACEAELQRFKDRQRQPAAGAKPLQLCGKCPRPEGFETLLRRQHLHMADVATLGDVASSLAWIANHERWDEPSTPTALMHLDFLVHVPSAVLRPMLAQCIRRVQDARRPAPALARLAICMAERDPAFLGGQEAFVLENLQSMAAGLRWACLEDFGNAGAPAWTAAPRLLRLFQELALVESQAPPDVHRALAAIQGILESSRPYRDVERPGRIPSPASLDAAPRRLPWEMSARSLAGRPETAPDGPAAPRNANRPAHAAASRGDAMGLLRLQVRNEHQKLCARLLKQPDLLASQQVLDHYLGMPLLALAPELRSRWSQSQFQKAAAHARLMANARQPQSPQDQRNAFRQLHERLVACLDAFSLGNLEEGNRSAASLWAWVVDDRGDLQGEGSQRGPGSGDAARSPAMPEVDRAMVWSAYDRAVMLPGCLREAVASFQWSPGQRGRPQRDFLRDYPLLDIGALSGLPAAKVAAIHSLASLLLQRESMRSQLLETVAQFEAMPPDVHDRNARLQQAKDALEKFSHVITNNASRTLGGCFGKNRIYPVDLLGTQLDPAAWRMQLQVDISSCAEATQSSDASTRAAMQQQYLRLRNIRLRVQWGDFEMAQAQADELWKQTLRQ